MKEKYSQQNDRQTERHVLLVDDNPDNLKLLSQILKNTGYSIKASTSGKFALQSVRANPPDLILLDIMMPEMDGYQVCRILKSSPETADIPVIFISALIDTQDKLEAFSAGGVDYISKPFQEAEVLARVNTHLALRNTRRELEELLMQRTAQLVVKAEELKEEIDERKQVSRRLQKSEQNYREIFDATDEAILIHDGSTGAILDVNLATQQMFGHSYAKILELTVEDISAGSPPYSSEEAYAYIKKAVKEGPQNFEWLCRRSNGELFWGGVTLKSSEIGGYGRVISVIRDISVSKETEKKLIESEEKYRQLFENANEGMAVIQDGVFKFFNPKTLMILGYEVSELQSKPFLEIVHQEDWGTASRLHQEKLQKNENSNLYKIRILAKDESEKYVESKSLIINWEGQPASLLFFTDITQRHLAELKQKKLESQLRQAQKMEAIGTLAGGVAHDFNNILAGIFGYTQLAQINIGEHEKLQRDLNQILSSAVRAKDLVQQILMFSRQAETELKPIQPHLVLQEALKLLRASIPASIEIREDIANTYKILADPTQLHQIVMNLGTNAYHAMREDKAGVLSVSLKREELEKKELAMESLSMKAGSYILLQISDTGMGMSKDIIERIFDPYFTTKPKEEGTGLGLSVVHGIVENYGGTISVYSEPGHGSTFKVYFPSISTEGKGLQYTPEVPVPTGTERIMVIDDDANVVETMSGMLTNLGYQVTSHTKSPEAIEDFEKRPEKFDLVITDMTMPHISGIEVGERLHSKRKELPIILCTGFSERINEKKYKEYGFEKYLMKPVIMKDLAIAVRDALDGI